MWLAIHTASNESPPSCVYYIITRQLPSSFTFQKIADPVEPFVPDKIPHHSLLRIRDYPPDLQDLLLVSSSASTEVGLLSRSKKPLASDKPADSITGVFTTTELLDDTRRPTLPMTDSMEDSTPVGFALDLSSKDKVYRPIPSDEELKESPTPLPGLWVLTHEGLLCAWWLVYSEAVKQGTAYPGLAVADASSATVKPSAPAVSASPFGATGDSAFGSTTPAAPAAPAAPAFGSSTQLGAKSSPWGAPSSTGNKVQTGGSTFGQSSFGSSASPSTPSFGKPSTFGQASQVGMRTSPWASAGGSAPAFGQSGFASFANKGPSSPSGAGAQNSNQPATAPSSGGSGGFAGFASQGGFASVATNSGPSVFGGESKSTTSPFASSATKDGPSVFGSGSKPASNPFASAGNNDGSSVFGGGSKPAPNPFASASATTGSSVFGGSGSLDKKPASVFGAKTENEKSSGTGVFGSQPFKLESSFKPDPSAKDEDKKPPSGSGGSMFGNAFGSALDAASEKAPASPLPSKDEDMDAEDSAEQTPQAKPQQSVFGSVTSPESTTPTTTPGPLRFGNTTTPATGSSIFGQPTPAASSGGSLFASKPNSKPSGFSFFNQAKETSKPDELEAPLPPDTTSRLVYPLGDSSSSSATSNAPQPAYGATTATFKADDAPLPPDPTSTTPKPSKTIKEESPESITGVEAPLPPDFVHVSKPAEAAKAATDAPLPPDFTKSAKPAPRESTESKADEAPLPPDFVPAKPPSKEPSSVPSVPESEEEESELEDDASEGSGVDVAKDLSPETSGMIVTPGFTPESSFGGIASTTPATAQAGQDRPRPLFGELSRNAPLFARPTGKSPRSPSPIRGAIPNRVLRSEATRSVSAPGMASHILGPQQPQSQLGNSIISREKLSQAEDSFVSQHRKLKERQEREETQPLVDEEDDQLQGILSSEVEPTLELDEFIAHPNPVPPAKESIPSQVEAVYRDINSMIDTIGLNARSVKAFVKGHTEMRNEEGRSKDDLEDPDSWVLCEIDELGYVLEHEVHADLEEGRVSDLEGKLEACQELSRDMQRLRAKQEDLKKIISTRTDPAQAEMTQSLPLSAEQAAQQNELRREFANFSRLLAEAEEALTLLKTRIVSVSGASGRGGTNVPTVEAVMRTITKMTTMVEKRSGDIDVLENQMRKLRVGSPSREGSPMVTPQAKRSVMFSPESTPSRFRHSFAASIGSLGSPARATPPRRKVSGFSKEEKSELMDKRARRQAVLGKLKDNVEKRGVHVWNMEDIE